MYSYIQFEASTVVGFLDTERPTPRALRARARAFARLERRVCSLGEKCFAGLRGPTHLEKAGDFVEADDYVLHLRHVYTRGGTGWLYTGASPLAGRVRRSVSEMGSQMGSGNP
eukprot:489808-Prorocentrum_minimum.AAC.1